MPKHQRKKPSTTQKTKKNIYLSQTLNALPKTVQNQTSADFKTQYATVRKG